MFLYRNIIRRLLFCEVFFYVHVSCIVVFVSSFDSDGGWNAHKRENVDTICNIDVQNGSLSQEDFLSKYAYTKPVILKNITNNEPTRNLITKQNLLSNYGEISIRLSSANSYSYEKVDTTLENYVNSVIDHFGSSSSFGNETFYFFGDVLSSELSDLLVDYKRPPYHIPNTRPAFSFGIGGGGSGVPFHFHGPGFSEVLYGSKHWFLYDFKSTPLFHPNMTSLFWYQNVYPKLKESEKPYECIILPGDVLYFPDRWWHSTLNLDNSVFVSTFLGPP